MQMLSVREAMEKRHSVRSYLSTPIPQDILLTMKQAVKEYASAAKMRIQLVTDEPLSVRRTIRLTSARAITEKSLSCSPSSSD